MAIKNGLAESDSNERLDTILEQMKKEAFDSTT